MVSPRRSAALRSRGALKNSAFAATAFTASRLAEISPALAARRTVVAHLGNGASLCAMRNGSSLDTTMGLTPLDGLMMGTRCGAIDPGVLLYLLRDGNMTVQDVEDLLYRRSGLL